MDNPQFLVALGFMIVTSILVILYGSIRSLRSLREKPHTLEIMSTSDASLFPFQGSLALFSLYFIFKLVPKAYCNALLTLYLTTTGIFCLGGFLKGIVRPSILTGLACVATGAAYFVSKHWVANNVLAVAIGVVAVENIQLGSFCTSAVLLSGLFFYDIFWVFGTDVMVTVAVSVDGPIKLLFPQTIFGDHEKKSLLGLGDIVIPGFFIAQTYIFSTLVSKGRNSFYFTVAMVAYFCSLVNTMVVMVVFKHAQPALLYIVPWLLVSTFLAGLAKGELGTMYRFSVEALVEQLHGKASSEPVKKGDGDGAAAPAEEGLVQALLQAVRELFGFGPEQVAATTTPNTKASTSTANSSKKAAPKADKKDASPADTKGAKADGKSVTPRKSASPPAVTAKKKD